MIEQAMLIEYAAEYGICVTPTQAQRFAVYAELLVDWNQRINLTAITAPHEIVLKHFVDSLTALTVLPPRTGEPLSLIDVGTGAGFPGVPLAILRDDIQLTLLDSLNKRLVFLRELCAAVEVPVTLLHARAEEGGRKPELRERFDVATARAVAALPTLCEYCLPFVKVGGRFIAMKGPDGGAELQAAEKACRLLGAKCGEMRQIWLPNRPQAADVSERRLIVLEKVSPTPVKYPRQSAKIAKQPL